MSGKRSTAMDTTLERPRKRVRRGSSDDILSSPPTTDLRQTTDEDGTVTNTTATENMLETALHVLATESAALAHTTDLYRMNTAARSSLTSAVSTIVDAQVSGSKLIACGVGKSAFIAMKFVASCKSLGIRASFMHACEAAHGDLGDVQGGDVVMFVSFSGHTPELVNVLPHIPDETRIIALTGQSDSKAGCRLLDGRPGGILLSAPVHESEECSFGVAAPTTSTVVAMAVADMLVLTVAEQLHGQRKHTVFKRNHPGGAIGMARGEAKKPRREVIADDLRLPSPEISGEDDR